MKKTYQAPVLRVQGKLEDITHMGGGRLGGHKEICLTPIGNKHKATVCFS